MALSDEIKAQLGIQGDPQQESQAPRFTPEQVKTLPLPDLIDYEICNMVTGRRKNSEDWRRLRRYEWDQCWKDMMQVPNKTNKAPWQMTTFMPLIPKTVEVITANLHAAIMGPEMPVEWQTRNRPDLDEQIRKTNDILAADFDKSRFKAHWTDFLRTTILCGTGIGYIDYAKEQEQVMIKQRRRTTIMDSIAAKFGKTPQLERLVPKQVLVKDYATFKHVDLYDMYPQPYTVDFSKDNWCIWKRRITNKELVDGSLDQDPYYKLNINDQLLLNSGSIRETDDPEKQIRRLAFLDYNIPTTFLDPDRQHELLEYYGPIPIWFLQPELRNDPQKRYDTVPGWIWVVDGQWVVRKRVTPWRDAEPPFVKGNYIRLPNQFYGTGVGQLLKGLQVEKNELRNLNVDNINIVMQKVTAVLKDKVPPDMWDRLVSEPGAIWAFQGIDDIRKALNVIEFPPMGQDIWAAQKQIDQEAQEASASTPAMLGTSGGASADNTFRGTMLMQQQGSQRFMLYARMFEICGLGDAIKKFYSRIYQFKNYEEIDYILGQQDPTKPPFELLAPEDMERVAKLVPIGVMTMENKGVKLAQMTEFFKLMMGQEFFKPLEAARKLWTEMGFPSPDSVLFSDEESQKFNQFKQQLLGQGMGAPNAPSAPQAPGQSVQSPFAGGSMGPNQGMPRPAIPQRGPGVSPVDIAGQKL